MRKRIVEFEAGYDCLQFECKHESKTCAPGVGASHGIHGLNLRFLVQGDQGAVQFLLHTGWMPQYCEPDTIGYRDITFGPLPPTPADLGYHSKEPRYEDQRPIGNECKFTGGGPCYYDGSGLNAYDAMYALVNGGDEALWEFLEAYYDCVFNDAPYPTPAEFPKPLRK